MQHGFRRALMAGAAIAALGVAGCGSSSDDGGGSGGGGDGGSSGGDPYVIGHITTFNPAVAAPSAYYRGMDAYFKQLNADGGVNGREVELKVFDDELDPQTALAGFRQLTKDDALAVTGLTISATLPGIQQDANRSRVPVVLGASPSSSATNPTTEYVFSFAEVFRDSLATMAAFTNDERLGTRVATLYFDGPESRIATDFAEEYLPSRGLEVSAVEYLPATATADYSKQIASVRDSGADVIFIIHSPSAMIAVKKAMDAAGLDIPVIANPSGLTKTVFDAFGDSTFYAESAWAPDLRAPGWADLAAAARRFGGERLLADQDSSFVGGWVGGTLIRDALERCGEDCDREGMRDALEALDTSELQGFSAPVSMSAQDHYAPTAAMVFGRRGDELVPLSEFLPFPDPE